MPIESVDNPFGNFRIGLFPPFSVGIHLRETYNIFGSEPVTMAGNPYPVEWYVVSDALVRYPAEDGTYFTQNETLVNGANAISIIDTHTGDPQPTLNFTMYKAANFIITTANNAFSYNVAETIEAQLDDGVITWSTNLPKVYSNTFKTYLGGQIPEEGDYSLTYSFTDPVGNVFNSTDNGNIFKWAPRVYIVSVDGNYNVEDPQPNTEKTSVAVRYIKGLEVYTENNLPVYDANGAIIYFGDISDETSVNINLDLGANDITSQIINIPDDFGNLQSAMNQIDISRDESTDFHLTNRVQDSLSQIWFASEMDGSNNIVASKGANDLIAIQGITLNEVESDPLQSGSDPEIYTPQTYAETIRYDNGGMYEENSVGAMAPETEWSRSLRIYNDATSSTYYAIACGNSTDVNITGLLIVGNTLYVDFGGTRKNLGTIVPTDEWYEFTLESYHDGVEWVYDFYMDKSKIHTSKGTSDYGTSTSTQNVVYGANYTNDTSITIENDFSGDMNSIVVSTTAIGFAHNCLYNNSLLWPVVSWRGDSNAVGVGATTELTSTGGLLFTYAETKKVLVIKTVEAGEDFYAGLEEKDNTPSWVASLPETRPEGEADKSLDYCYDSLLCSMIMDLWTQNFITAGYTEPNPAGYNNVADEFGYGIDTRIAFAQSKSIPSIHTTPMAVTPASKKDDCRLVSDTLSADSKYLNTEIYNLQELTRVSAGDDSLKPEYDAGDTIHTNDDGQLMQYNEFQNFSQKYLDDTLEFYYDPVVVITNHSDGDRALTEPITINWTIDGVAQTPISQDLVLGDNEITLDHTNKYARYGSTTITIRYYPAGQLPVTNQYAMDTITSSQILDEVGTIDIDVFGSETTRDDGFYFNGTTDYAVAGTSAQSNDWLNVAHEQTISLQIYIDPSAATFSNRVWFSRLWNNAGTGFYPNQHDLTTKVKDSNNDLTTGDWIQSNRERWIPIIITISSTGVYKVYVDKVDLTSGGATYVPATADNNLPFIFGARSDTDTTVLAEQFADEIVIRNFTRYDLEGIQADVDAISDAFPT